MQSIKIQIPSIIENIRIVESFIDNAREQYSITDELYGNIMVAVTESVNNAIVHGNKLIKEKYVYLNLYMENGAIIFKIEDEGTGFDYKNLPDPTAAQNLEIPGGRGIFLMRHLSDEVCFEEEGRCVKLSFYVS